MTNTDQKILWLAVSFVGGIGPGTIRKKFAERGSILSVWEELELSDRQRNDYMIQASNEFQQAANRDIRIITLDDPEFPGSLKELSDIPPVLYVLGQLETQDQRAIGIVGSRMVSQYGREVTEIFARQIAANGCTVVSGMAKGVDTVAHQSALDQGGRTIAVWGSGLDLVYPAENKRLAEKIIENGALISQFQLGAQAQRFTFPLRNKLIAGLSQAIVVTEAKAKSGSLLTTESAQKYGRPVFAAPGSLFSPGSAGPHQLIQKGAGLAIDAADIVKSLGIEPRSKGQHKPIADITAQEEELINILQLEPLHIDEIIRQSLQPSSQVSSLIVMMELKGLIKHLGDGHYRKI